MEVKVTEGQDYYHYTTEEKVMFCPNCKREYKRRKKCLNCKTPTEIKIKKHTGNITKDLKMWNCSCLFGSWFRWGIYWKEVHPTSTCRHFKAVLKVIKSGE